MARTTRFSCNRSWTTHPQTPWFITTTIVTSSGAACSCALTVLRVPCGGRPGASVPTVRGEGCGATGARGRLLGLGGGVRLAQVDQQRPGDELRDRGISQLLALGYGHHPLIPGAPHRQVEDRAALVGPVVEGPIADGPAQPISLPAIGDD